MSSTAAGSVSSSSKMSAESQEIFYLESNMSHDPESGVEIVYESPVKENDPELEQLLNPYAIIENADEASVTSSEDAHERQILPQGDEFGRPVHIPGEEIQRPPSKRDVHEGKKEAPRSVIQAGIESVKYMYSTTLLVFSITVAMAAIFTEQTTATAKNGLHPVLAFFIFWILILWLAFMEGGQGALVGLQPIDKQLYSQSHPKAYRNTSLAHKGDNMERFIVGRQFLVVLVVFVINFMGSAIDGANVFNLNEGLRQVFLSTGVAVILTTIMVGQLVAQINAASCMLDFVNNYFITFTIWVSLAIEYSGLLHAVYLVQSIFERLAGKKSQSDEPSQTAFQLAFHWFRVLLSLAVLGMAFAVTLTALFDGKTAMWEGVPETVSVVIFFLLMCFVGLMEGMQIALFAVINLDDEELKKHPTAFKNCELAFASENLQAFLIGRQICVTICTFVIARITSVDVDLDVGEETIFGVSNGLQRFINTGLLGALITTIVASLAWRIIASSFPLSFLSNPLIYFVIRLCLLLERSGVCSASWILARYQKIFAKYQADEVYLENTERQGDEPVTRRDKDIDRLIAVSKYTFSLALLLFSIVTVSWSIFEEKTTATMENNVPGVVAFIVFWLLILLLAIMEGGQGALVGLEPVDKELYKESHPRSLLSARIVHEGDNVERFIIGRQFLVVLIVFTINYMATAVDQPSVLGLPSVLNEIFVSTGLGAILTTIIVGQLTAQVNAATCMLDFINNYAMYVTTRISLLIEMSGLLHAVYLVQYVFERFSVTPSSSKEPEKSKSEQLIFWIRVTASLIVLGLALAVTLAALFEGKTKMWNGVPDYASVIIFFVLMGFVGVMEGMQIALFAVVNLPEGTLQNYPVAHKNSKLAFRDQNLPAFLIGRQICVTICMFVIARITTIDVDIDSGEDTIFGVSYGFQRFLNTGLLGAVITTIVASLAWRIVASSFPLSFLSNPLVDPIIRVCMAVEATGVCSSAWVLARWNKLLAGFQPDSVYLSGAERHGKKPTTKRDKDIDVTITVLKYLYSSTLLIFSITIVMAAIFTEQTNVSERIHPAFAFFVFWGLLAWLALMEGGQGCLVGLQPVNRELYRKTHQVTYKNTAIAHKEDNMARFIIGRQFLVVLVVFVINLCGSAISDAKVFSLSDGMNEVFLASGVALILTTIIAGQLAAQINAANCMLDFVNTYFMTLTVWISLAIEKSGLLHSVYLVQMVFERVSGKTDEKRKDASTATKALFWIRVIFSVGVLGFAFAVTLAALFSGKTAMWDGVPESASVVVFFVLMCFVGMMEGMQIALFAVINLPAEELQQHSTAYKNCNLIFGDNNFQAFLVGRQICVTICTFVIARITTINVDTDLGDDTIFGVGQGFQEFLNTGLLGAVITTIVASLAWRIIGSSFPIAFMSNPLVYFIIRLCLALEASGVCSAAWILARIQKQVAHFQTDESYIGTIEERLSAEQESPRNVNSTNNSEV